MLLTYHRSFHIASPQLPALRTRLSSARTLAARHHDIEATIRAFWHTGRSPMRVHFDDTSLEGPSPL